MTKSRVTNVQVPGESKPETTNTETESQESSATQGEDQGNDDAPAVNPGADADALQAQNDALHAELAALKAKIAQDAKTASAKPVAALKHGVGGRDDFKHLRADQVDVSTLKASVLTSEGWLVPAVIGAEPKEKA